MAYLSKNRLFIIALIACFLITGIAGCNKPTSSESDDSQVSEIESQQSEATSEAVSEISEDVSESESISSLSQESSISETSQASQASQSSAAVSSVISTQSTETSSTTSSEDEEPIEWTMPTSVNTDLGPLPSVSNPSAGADSSLSQDGKWYYNNLSAFQNERLIVNAKDEHGIAFYTGQGLGDTWNVSATVRMIKRYPEDQPICARIFVRDIYNQEVFIYTLNFINDSVEIMLQVHDRVWKTLVTTDGWKDTSSTVYSFGLRREAGSKKISVYVLGDKGMILDRTSPINLSDTILDKVAVAGFGAFSSAVEYSDMLVIGNGNKNVTFQSQEG